MTSDNITYSTASVNLHKSKKNKLTHVWINLKNNKYIKNNLNVYTEIHLNYI